MGFNLKEKLQSIRKKHIIIASVILVVLLVCVVGGFEYSNYKTMKAKAERDARAKSSYEFGMLNLNGEPKKPSEYAIGIEYKKAMKSKKPVLVLFYADWCHFCIKFMPLYQALSEKYKDDMDFSKVNVEDKQYEKLVNEIGITGFPTVYIIDPKYDNKVLLSNAILGNIDDVSIELDRFLRIRKMLESKKK